MALVLVVDDDFVVAKMVAEIVAFCRHKAVIETSSIDALTSWSHDERLMVVITDYLLPKLDGIELLTVLRDTRPDVRRVLITAAPLDARAIQEAEADGTVQLVISKPPTIGDIRHALAWL